MFSQQLARKFLGVVPRVYPEILRKVVIVRAPWVFQKIWVMFRPLFPGEIISKISIHAGMKNFASIFDVLPDERVPRMYGGNWATQNGEDDECRSHLGPGITYWDGSLEREYAR